MPQPRAARQIAVEPRAQHGLAICRLTLGAAEHETQRRAVRRQVVENDGYGANAERQHTLTRDREPAAAAYPCDECHRCCPQVPAGQWMHPQGESTGDPDSYGPAAVSL